MKKLLLWAICIALCSHAFAQSHEPEQKFVPINNDALNQCLLSVCKTTGDAINLQTASISTPTGTIEVEYRKKTERNPWNDSLMDWGTEIVYTFHALKWSYIPGSDRLSAPGITVSEILTEKEIQTLAFMDTQNIGLIAKEIQQGNYTLSTTSKKN